MNTDNMTTEERKELGKVGELIAYRWLAERKELLLKSLNLDDSYELYFALKKGEYAKSDIKTIICDVMQEDFGIDILVGKFIDDVILECPLTIDAKYASGIYFEMFGLGLLNRKLEEIEPDKETGKRNFKELYRKFSIPELKFNYPKVNDIESFKGMRQGEISKINNNYALAYIFVWQENEKNPLSNTVIGKQPLIFAEDIEQALKTGYLEGYRTWAGRRSHLIIPNSASVTEGNRQDIRFGIDELLTGIRKYKNSIAKESTEGKITFSEKDKPQIMISNTGWEYVKVKQGDKDITVKFKVKKTPFIIVHEEGQEVVNIKTSDIN